MELEVISNGTEIYYCVCLYVCSSLSEIWLSCLLCSLKSKCSSSFPVKILDMQLSIGSACPIGTVDKLWTPP